MKTSRFGVVGFFLLIFLVSACEAEQSSVEIKNGQHEVGVKAAVPKPGCRSASPSCQGACAASNWRGKCGDRGGCVRITWQDGTTSFECWNENWLGMGIAGIEKPSYPTPIHHFDVLRSVDGFPLNPYIIGQLASNETVEFIPDPIPQFNSLEYEMHFFDDLNQPLGVAHWIYTD